MAECGCRWVSISDGRDGGDGEFVPCPDHAVVVDFAAICRDGWPEEPCPW